jgi:AcrR family transcriptional regulator
MVGFRERHRDEVRRSILQAAGEAFSRHGYEAVSMRGIAESIGLSHGSIYGYFADKEAIFDALSEESFARLAEALRAIGRKRDPVSFLRAAGRAYVEFGLRNPGAYEFAFVLRRPGAEAAKPHLAYDYLRAAVQRCIDAGRFRLRDADAAGQALWAAVHGVTALLIARPSFPWTSKKALIGRVVDSAVDGLLTRASTTPSSGRPPRRRTR